MLYASATHPPTSRDLEPYWQVGEWRWPFPPPTHLLVGKTPLVGVLPYYSVGRHQLPLSHKLTPSSLPPYSMFMTEVTSMPSTSNAVLSRLKLSPSVVGSSYLSNIHKFLKKASTKVLGSIVIMDNIEKESGHWPT